MDERDWLAERFHEHRPRLRAVAYRMLGSTSEADDAVQEAWIRLSRSNVGEIDNLEAWLVTAVGRVALNMLRSRKTRREEPLDAHRRTRSSTAQTASTLSTPDALVAVLDPDILVREDMGTGTIVQVHGAENVARRAAAVSRLGLVGRPALINGAAGWVSLLDGDVFAIVALTLQNGRITTMDILLDPARLALTAFASRP
jgi:DNA-directed RNA polymerase specialized sigma24 family protein